MIIFAGVFFELVIPCIFPPKNIANNLSKKFLQSPSLLYKRSLDGSKNIRTHRHIHIQTYTQAYNEI